MSRSGLNVNLGCCLLYNTRVICVQIYLVHGRSPPSGIGFSHAPDNVTPEI